MKRRIAVIIAVMLLGAAAAPASAQRTAKGEFSLSLDGCFIPMNGFGGDIRFGIYTMTGFWDFGIDIRNLSLTLSGPDVAIPASSLGCDARAGYMYRLTNTRDRTINLYAGGGISLGAAPFFTSEEGMSELGFTDTPVPFVYGLYPKVEVEIFFSRTVAFDVALAAPFNFYTKNYNILQRMNGIVRPQLSAGLKFNF